MDDVSSVVWFFAFCAFYLVIYGVFLRALMSDDEEDGNEN